MFLLACIASVTASTPDDAPLPDFSPGRPVWFRNELAVAVGLWQLPSVGSGHARLPRYNAYVLYGVGFGKRRRGRFAVQFGAQSIPYGPEGAGGGRRTTVRFEPRLTHRFGSNRASVDAGLGLSLEAGGQFPLGPALIVEPRGWLGERRRTFVGVEARLAPMYWGVTNLIYCPEWCNATRIMNPGGTGLLLRVGRVLDGA